MAICESCNQEMTTADACTLKTYGDFVDEVERYRIPYDGLDGERCHDCNVVKGALHHPGCDVEICPCCGGQAILCDCTGEQEDEW